MTGKFTLDDKVWWIRFNDHGGFELREGVITGMRWRRAFLKSRRKVFLVEHHEVYADYLYHSKEDAVSGMISSLQKLLD